MLKLQGINFISSCVLLLILWT